SCPRSPRLLPAWSPPISLLRSSVWSSSELSARRPLPSGMRRKRRSPLLLGIAICAVQRATLPETHALHRPRMRRDSTGAASTHPEAPNLPPGVVGGRWHNGADHLAWTHAAPTARGLGRCVGDARGVGAPQLPAMATCGRDLQGDHTDTSDGFWWAGSH